MPSIIKSLGVVAAGFAAMALAAPAFTSSQLKFHELSKRQNAAAAALGLTDPDILQL